MLTVRLGVGLAEVLARTRAHAFGQGRTLIDLAHEIIGGSELRCRGDLMPTCDVSPRACPTVVVDGRKR